MKMSKWICLPIVVLSLSFVACDKETEGADTKTNFSDTTFSLQASMININVVAASQVAADSTSDSTVAAYAAMIVSNHSAAEQQLQSVTSPVGLATSNTVDGDHVSLIDSLKTLKGRALDSVYIFSQIRDQEKAIFVYKDHEAHGLLRNLKFYNYDMLDVLTSQLQQARTIAQKY